MNNLNEQELKNKFNNYMEQIKVPENLGGIIMEDFKKIKKEENAKNIEVKTQNEAKEQNESVTNNSKKEKGSKIFKISLGSVAAVALVGASIFLGTKLTGNKIVMFDNHGAQSGSMAGDNSVQTISTDHLSKYVGNWYSEDSSSLEIKSIDNNEIKFVVSLYRLTNIDDATGTLQNQSTANFVGKNDYNEEVNGTVIFEDSSIKITFASNTEHIKSGSSYIFTKSNVNKKIQQVSTSITETEKQQLQVFLNKPENNPWTLLTYTEPKDLFNHTHNIGLNHEVDAAEILRYSIKLGQYGKNQDNVYGTEPGFVSTQEDMNKFFKDKLYGSNFTNEEIQKAFKNDYNKNVIGKYTFWVSDSCMTPVVIESGYKENENSYKLTLNHGQNIKLIKDTNGNYLFYSCEGFNGKMGGQSDSDLTETEKSEITTFLNLKENNPLTLLTYTEPKDLFNHTHNIGLNHEVDAAEILRYSIKLGQYGKSENNVYGTEPGFVSTQEDMNRFFKDKLYGSNFTNEEIQKAFKNDYNKNVANKYTFWVTDSCYTSVSIVSGTKTYDNKYSLKLNHGQVIILIKDTDGKYKFFSCVGFDGKMD